MLIGFLAQAPAHGYELHRQLAAHLGTVWNISLSQAYAILKRLEARGDIAGAQEDAGPRPARRRYRLTRAGRRRFEDWLRAPSRVSVRIIRVEFISRLFFATARDPELAAQLVEQQAALVRDVLKRLQEQIRAIPQAEDFSRLGIDLRIRQLQSLLDWLVEVPINALPRAAPPPTRPGSAGTNTTAYRLHQPGRIPG